MAELLKGFRLNPRVKWRWEGKDKILLNTMIGMNKTAGQILELCEKMHTLRDVTEEVSRRYPKTPKEKIKSDTEKWISKLLKWNILIPKEAKEKLTPLPKTSFYLRHIASYFGNKLRAPVGVVCELTYVCEANCPHCFTKIPSPDPNELTTSEWKNVMNELHDLSVFAVSFSGGDPLLRNDVEELVRYVASKGLDVQLVTNGLMFTEDKIDTLALAGLRSARIDLDAANPKTHDSFRGIEGLHQHVTKMISCLLEKNISVEIATTLSGYNIDEIPDTIELAWKLGVRRITLDRLYSVGPKRSEFWLNMEDYMGLLPRVYETDKKLGNMAIKYPDMPAAYYKKGLGLSAYEKLKREGKIGACQAGVLGCVISPVGNVKPCTTSMGITLGNVRRDSFGDVWNNSDVFDHLRRLSKGDQIPCRDCSFCGVCTAGCRALPSQIGRDGDRYAADPLCFECFKTFRGE